MSGRETKDASAALKRVELLRHLPGSELDQLSRSAVVARYKQGALLFEEGARPDHLFILLDGLVELFASRRKRQAAVLIMWPPAVFLPAAALSNERYLLSGRTLTPSEFIVLDAADVREQVASSAALGKTFTALLSAQFRLLVRQLKDQKLRNGPQRLCAFLSRVLRETGKNGYADLPIPKAVLASWLGMTPENLSRSLQSVEQHGIKMNGSRIILTNARRAAEFCDPDPLFDGPDDGLKLNHL